MIYAPAPGSLAHRVCTWFAANPEEELTSGDIARKFDTAQNNVGAQLAACFTHQMLVRFKDDGVWLIKAGTMLPAKEDLQTGPTQTTQTPASSTPKAAPAQINMPDPATLKISKGIPIPKDKAGPNGRRYATVFEAMGTGDSIEVPYEAGRRIYQSAYAFGKPTGKKFKMRQTSTETSRIWRVA